MSTQTPASDAVNQAKSWFKSKTYWGIIIMVLSFVAKNFIPEVDVEGILAEVDTSSAELATQADAIYAQVRYGLWTDITEAFGALLAAWGRIKAKASIK